MTITTVIVWTALLLVGLGLSALWSGFETGLYAMSRVRLRLEARSGGGARLLERESGRLDRMLATILLGNNASNYVGTLALSQLLIGTGISAGAAALLQVLILTPLLLIFAEALPKEVFRLRAERLTIPLAPAVTAVRVAATWSGLLGLVLLMTGLLARLTRVSGAPRSRGRDRLVELLRESGRGGAMSETQRRIADSALATAGLDAMDVMTPLRACARVGARATLGEAASAMRAAGASVALVFGDGERSLGGVGWAACGASSRRGEPAVGSAVALPEVDASAPIRRAFRAAWSSRNGHALVVRAGRPVGVVSAEGLASRLLATS